MHSAAAAAAAAAAAVAAAVAAFECRISWFCYQFYNVKSTLNQ